MTAARVPSQNLPVSQDFDRDITALIAPASDARHGTPGAAFEARVGDRCLRIFAAPDRRLDTPEVFACFCGSLSDPSGSTHGVAALAVLAEQLRAGPPDPDDLRGSFAIIAYDKVRHQLHSFRDPIGNERLWRSTTPPIAVTSSLLQLRSLVPGDWPFALDDAVYRDAWRRNYVHPGRSTFRGLEQQPIGTGATLDLTDLRTETFGFRPKVTRPGETLAPAAAAEAARSGLARSLRRLGAAHRKTTVLLSGGVDSTLIAEILAEVGTHGAIDGRCVGALLPIWGDEFYARYAARRLGLPMRTLRPGPSRVAEPLLHATARFELPIFDRALVAAALLASEAKGNGADLILTGDCADGLFMGQGEAERWIRAPDDPEPWPSDTIDSGPPLADWLSPWGAAAPNSAVGFLGAKLRGVGRAYGIDAATPFLDWDLMCLARSLPPEILLRDRRSKALLKDALTGWPQWFVERRKVGFMFNDKWIWLLSDFEGLREAVVPEALELAGEALPASLRGGPTTWRRGDIRRHYFACLKLLIASRWLGAYGLARR